jgi:hypothetical protein
LRLAFRLQTLAKPLARALATLLSPTKQDTGMMTEEYLDKEGAQVSKTTINAIDPTLAKTRVEQRAEAVEELVGTLLAETNRDLIAELFIDATTAPKERPRGDISQEDIDEMGSGLDLGTTIQMFMGVAKANASVFGNVGEKLARVANEALARATQQPVAQASESTSTETPTDKDGSSSKTP